MKTESDPSFFLIDRARAELTESARFAVDLVNFLESKLDAHLADWNNTSPARHIAHTCQIVEGLDAIAIPHNTSALIARALDWLLNLPTPFGLTQEESQAARRHPSRFKTLAQMGRLNDESPTLQEFRALCEEVQTSDGTLHDTPVSSPVLATMIWLDTMFHLNEHDWSMGKFKKRYACALETIYAKFITWRRSDESRGKKNPNQPRAKRRTKHAPNHSLQLTDDGNASYALDLLIRHHKLTLQDAETRDGKNRLLRALDNRKRNDWRNYEPLYCAIQLSAHFHDDAQVQSSVTELVNDLRAAFEHNQFQDQELPLAALSLRVLGVLYQTALAEQIHRDHWTFQRAEQNNLQLSRKQAHVAELSQIVRDTFKIQIDDDGEERLSNADAVNQVVRVRFGFESLAVDDHEQSPRAAKNALHLILKQGSASALQQAIETYRALPPGLQSYFAEHAPISTPDHNAAGSSNYLVMRDLAAMELLSDVLRAHDHMPFDSNAERVIIQTARQVALAFQALHHNPQTVSGATNQLERLYLMPLSASIDWLCDTQFFALRAWVEDGFDVGKFPYKRLTYYLNEIRKQEKLLRPSKLGRLHGDAHSRNLMLDATRQRVKFIDVESFATDQDYVLDYALLIEDLAFYTYLPHRKKTTSIQPDQIVSILASEEQQSRNTLQYPPFPPNSGAALLFQQTLLTQLASFAHSIGDVNWKPRLWLAVAKSLLMLLERQTRSKRLNGDGRENLNLVLVIYAEAVRLLDELVAAGARPQQLAELPFMGKRVASREMDERALMRQIVQWLEKLPFVTVRSHPNIAPWLQFFVGDPPKLFAEFHNKTREAPFEFILYAPLERLKDTEQLVTTRKPLDAAEQSSVAREVRDGFVIPKSRLVNLAAVQALSQNAHQYALETPFA